MQYIQLAPDLTFSRLIQGFWRLKSWQKSPQELLTFVKQGFHVAILCEATFNQKSNRNFASSSSAF